MQNRVHSYPEASWAYTTLGVHTAPLLEALLWQPLFAKRLPWPEQMQRSQCNISTARQLKAVTLNGQFAAISVELTAFQMLYMPHRRQLPGSRQRCFAKLLLSEARQRPHTCRI